MDLDPLNKRNKPLQKVLKILGILMVIALPTLFMTLKIISTPTVDCEVCMEFRGRSKCRKASGPKREDCQLTATDNACAFLASGMTDSIQCAQKTPVSVKY